jgi:hypothetical protein
MTTAPQTAPSTPLSKLNKAGLVLAFLLGLADIAAVFFPPTPEGQVGPPDSILLLDSLLGLITVVAVVVAWRTTKRAAIRLTAGARILSMVTALPAFFVEVPPGVKVLVGVFVLLTVASVVMMLAPARRPAPVTD